MTRRFVDYLANEFAAFSDLAPINDDDTWLEDFQKDQTYLEDALVDLRGKSVAVEQAVRWWAEHSVNTNS